MSVRVVAGVARGRRLDAPDGSTTRPTGDRVREAMFNALASLSAIEDASVLDAFAGSGALGIEALSRGAASCTFVEPDRGARTVVERNLAATDLADLATVEGGEALAHLARTPDRYDLVLLDPPYAFDGWPTLLGAVATRLADQGIVVVESDREVEVAEPLTVLRAKRYGGTVVIFAMLPTPSTPAGDPE